jgi:hypothetical protein
LQQLQDQLQDQAGLRQQLQQLQEQLQDQAGLRQQLQDQAKQRLQLLAGNAVIDLAKFVYQKYPSAVENSSTHQLQQLAARVTDKQLRECQIPTKYWPFIRNIAKVF